MVVSLGTQRSGLALPGAARTALRARCERAIRRARRSGEDVLAGVSLRLTPDADPSAVAFASRRPGEPWFCLEQPDRDGAALATLGAVVRLRAAGPRRFTVLGLRTFALGEPAEVDVTVPLGAVTDRSARGAGADLPVPPTRAIAAWSAVTPPRGPWEPAGTLPGDLLAAVARDGLAEVTDAVRERGAAAGLVRDRVWARDVLEAAGPHPDLLDHSGGFEGGASVRSGGAFAAYALGFLAPGQPVQVLRSNRWTRLTAPGGHVLIR